MQTRVLWFTFACIVAISTPVMGEQASRETARRHYAEGQALFNAGNYQAAMAEFRAANEIAPHPVTLKSIAECLERLGRVHEAVDMFEQYLREAPTARDADEIRQRVAEHRARPGRLRIQSNPPGAAVTLDGQRVEGVTPLDLQVNSGQHAVAIQMEGYQMVLEEFNMPFAGNHTINAQLQGPGGRPQPTPTPTPVTPPGTEEPDREWRVTTPVWAMVGVTGAALVTGIVTGSLALADQGDFDDQLDDEGVTSENRQELRDLGDSGETKALIADISFGVAAAAAVTGIVLFFVQNRDSGSSGTAERPRRRSSPITIAPAISENGGGITAIGRF